MTLLASLIFSLLGLLLKLSEDHNGCCVETDWMLPRPNITDLIAVNDKQSLEVIWLINSSGLGDRSDIYEIQIGRTENLTIIYNSNVSAHPVGSDTFSWTWTSSLPLECADHSVRIRRFYNRSISSPWSKWMTNNGAEALMDTEKNTRMFPFQQVLKEGASTMLCCIPPRGVHITSMAFDGSTYPLISIGDRVKAIAVNLTIPKRLFKEVLFSCTDTTAKTQNCFNYISFPPQKPKNISCSTSDLKTVNCTWDPGRKSNLFGSYRRTHTLYIENSDQRHINCEESFCHFAAVPHLEEYNVSVVVRNQLGEERESYSFNISDRVFPVLEWGRAHRGVTNTTLSWIIQGNLSRLDFLCQVVTNPESTTMVSCQSVSRYCKVKLEDLLPNTRYTTRARCTVKGKLWGDWTRFMSFTTYPLVTLDVWRRVEQLSSNNLHKVTLLWTPRVPGSAASNIIQGYMVRWSQGGRNGTEWKDSGQTQAEFTIGPGQCDFTVQADIRAGSSIPAHITVPQIEDRENLLLSQRVSGSTNGGFHLTWAEYSSVTCGYTVQWCIVGTVFPCTLQWRMVPEGNNTLFLPARHFEAGYRYTFNIYGCTESGHKLLEIQTGYTQELKSVQSPSLVGPVRSTSSSVTLEWLYSENDQAGFITGYLVSVQEVGHETSPGFPTNLLNVTVNDPRKKSVTIEGLQENQDYTFYLCALTKTGSGPPATITIRTKANYFIHLAKILTPILLLLCCTIPLWPQRTMLKSGLKGILFYPAGMNIKTIEIDSFLHEKETRGARVHVHLSFSWHRDRQTSERLRSQTVEECVSCDIEVLDTRPPVTETTTLIVPELLDSPSSPDSQSSSSPFSTPPQADYRPQSAAVLWERPVLQRMTSVTNQSYFHTRGEDFFELEEAAPKGVSDITTLESSLSLQESWSIIDSYISNEALSM